MDSVPRPSAASSSSQRRANDLRVFTLGELEEATGGFSTGMMIGEGGFGCVYRGVVRVTDFDDGNCSGSNMDVAVKQLNRNGIQARLFFPVPLSMYLCAYEQIIFLDLKTSHILLDENFNAKLSDFGRARQGPAAGLSHISTSSVAHPTRYAAPEYIQTGRFTAKSDVWSFGVVLYELITGRRAVEKNMPRNEQKLLDWVRPYVSDSRKFHLIVDPRLEDQYCIKSAKKLAALADKCLAKNAKSRPKMSEVVEMLGKIISETSSENDSTPQHAKETQGKETKVKKEETEKSIRCINSSIEISLRVNLISADIGVRRKKQHLVITLFSTMVIEFL
ncbi:hypothetical protein RHGRI_002461 [Rhododendron griersonianum]|uniref:Protein kinase domain-containing protein n=1 Tax=Rhododendron griersonianum TaxID=479676 RepID=A0AAV6LQB8_9ERIC|nr:hypothetical protein RHGRI_002461 [Rhododendron griersonianum]